MFARPPPPLSPYFLSVKPEVNNFVNSLRYLGDVKVACRFNKKIRKYRKYFTAAPPRPAPPVLFVSATGNRYIFEGVLLFRRCYCRLSLQ